MVLFQISSIVFFLCLLLYSAIASYADPSYEPIYQLKLAILLCFALVIPSLVRLLRFRRLKRLIFYTVLTSPLLLLAIAKVIPGECASNRVCFALGDVNTVPTMYALFVIVHYLIYITKSLPAYSKCSIWFYANSASLIASIGILLFVSLASSSRTSLLILFLLLAFHALCQVAKSFRKILASRHLDCTFLFLMTGLVFALFIFVRYSSTYVLVGLDVLLNCTILSAAGVNSFSLTGLPASYICSTASARLAWADNASTFLSFSPATIAQYTDNEITAIANHSGLFGLILFAILLYSVFRIFHQKFGMATSLIHFLLFFGVCLFTRELFTSLFSFGSIVLLLSSVCLGVEVCRDNLSDKIFLE
jgi:hypothetical protein